jgi:hypothetical protein
VFSSRLPDEAQPRRGMPDFDAVFSQATDSFWSFPCLIFLSGCSAKPLECDSFETRNAVLKTVSDDHNNPLVKYAAQNPNMAKSSGAGSEAEKQKPLYLLGDKILPTSTSKDKRTLTCRGEISVQEHAAELAGAAQNRLACRFLPALGRLEFLCGGFLFSVLAG